MKAKKIYRQYFAHLCKQTSIENDKLYQIIIQFEYCKIHQYLQNEEILSYFLIFLEKNIFLLEFSSSIQKILSWNHRQLSDYLLPFFETIILHKSIYKDFPIYLYFEIFFKQGLFFPNGWLEKQLQKIEDNDLLSNYINNNIENHHLFLKKDLNINSIEVIIKKI